MKKDLYGALGVGKDASKAEIRAAYRKAAKRAHPDAGGSVESFALVTLAKDTLSDDEKRARFDRTGDAEEQKADQFEANALEWAWRAVEGAMLGAAKRGEITQFDIISDAVRSIQIDIDRMDHARADMLEGARQMKTLQRRFRAKKGKTDRLSPILETRIRQTEEAAEEAIRDRPKLLRAQEILREHEFQTDAADPYAHRSPVSFFYMVS